MPGLSRYSALLAGRRPHGSRSSDKTSKDREELAEFRARVEAGSSSKAVDAERDWFARMEHVGDVARVDQRWTGSWMGSARARDLRPLRVPLHSKKSKRCPMCRHIIIKPEQKSQSVRYKIKLTATAFLPAMSVTVPAPTTVAGDGTPQFHAGRTFPFRLAFTNPMYEPITVTLAVQRAPMLKGRPPFAVSLPSPPFTVSAYAEAWEYEDDDDMMEDDDIDALLAGGVGSPRERERESRASRKPKTVGVLERKANTTVVGGELVIGKEGRGDVKVCSLTPRLIPLLNFFGSSTFWSHTSTKLRTPRGRMKSRRAVQPSRSRRSRLLNRLSSRRCRSTPLSHLAPSSCVNSAKLGGMSGRRVHTRRGTANSKLYEIYLIPLTHVRMSHRHSSTERI